MSDRPTSISAKNSGGPNFNASPLRAEQRHQSKGRDDAADERAEGGNPEGGAPRPWFAI